MATHHAAISPSHAPAGVHAAKTAAESTRPQLSVVLPLFNERDNISALIDEIVVALRDHGDFEIVCVDDASSDDTAQVLAQRLGDTPVLRVIRHRRQSGQSTAIVTGVRAARAPWIATLDGDGQNDPADLPRLLAIRNTSPDDIGLFAGWRQQRRDSVSKRWASRLANGIRARLLQDDTPDTGCGIKLFRREDFLRLPAFNHMHRYLPALMKRAGLGTLSVPVNHRPRRAGVSKYGNLSRALVGIADLRGVAWLMRRPCLTDSAELTSVDLLAQQYATTAATPPVKTIPTASTPNWSEVAPATVRAGS